MRIDPNSSPGNPSLSGLEGASVRKPVQGSEGSTRPGDDSAQLSFSQGAIAALKTQLAHMPEIRQERVMALRQAVADGTYQVTPRQIAQGMFQELMEPPRDK